VTVRRLAGAVLTVATVAACAETTVDPTRTTTATVLGSAAPTTAFTPAGSAIELLPDLSTELSRLSAAIVDDDDPQGALARVEALWGAARNEVGADRRELVAQFEAAIELARTAVERRRPADADKAFNNLSALVDAYVGDA